MHLHPQAAERVIDKKLHDISRREELVAYGQFPAVTRRLALLAHSLALFAAIEELVDPADRLVLTPNGRQIGDVEDGQKRLKRLPLRPQDGGNITPVKQNLDFGRELVKQAFDVEPIP